MTQLYNQNSSNKYFIMTSIMSEEKHLKLFNEMDTLLLQKRFDNAYELSLTENLLRIGTHQLTGKCIKKIITDFIANDDFIYCCEDRVLYEIVKISNLPSEKLQKAIRPDLYQKLATFLISVSRETTMISTDFLILRILDNFMIKTNNQQTIDVYESARLNILSKITTYNYKQEKKEKETTLLCWIDRILNAAVNIEISPISFISLSEKLLNLAHYSTYAYWKLLHSVNYLLLQPDFSYCTELRLYKKRITNAIGDHYRCTKASIKDVKELTISTLAKKQPTKEDFYYLFDIIKKSALKNEENKLFCLILCKYLIKYNRRQNIFSHRFIRKYFIEMIFELIKQPTIGLKVKEEQMAVLISLFHVDTYFCFNRYEIFDTMIDTLKSINTGKTKLSYTNFYKYCDALDYIMSQNPDIKYSNIVEHLSLKKDDKEKICKFFDLILEQQSTF